MKTAIDLFVVFINLVAAFFGFALAVHPEPAGFVAWVAVVVVALWSRRFLNDPA